MYQQTNAHFEALSIKKLQYSRSNPVAFFVQAMMAGGYVGIGIILIYSVAAPLDPSVQKLVMGLSFGVALTLVVFAGAELFTGHTMYFTTGMLRGKISISETVSTWMIVWWGNLAGAIVLTVIYFFGQGTILTGPPSELLMKAALFKINSGAVELVARGALCNWLVCLAIWMAARVNSDSAKAIVVFWALFAFISSGYEHSVANMTLLSLALIADLSANINILSMANNLFWVSIGNIIGGALFISIGYHIGSNSPLEQKANEHHDTPSVTQHPESH